jgi:hypothetical protein
MIRSYELNNLLQYGILLSVINTGISMWVLQGGENGITS